MPGGNSASASALALKQRFPSILQHLRKRIYFIIFDGPALLDSADATVLASLVDGVVLVVDARHNKLPILQRAKEIVSSLTNTSTGVVFNHVVAKRSSSYYVSAFPKVNKTTSKVSTQRTTSTTADSQAPFDYPIAPLVAGSLGSPNRLNIPSSGSRDSIFS